MSEHLNVAIIGCGNIGSKRAKAIQALARDRITAIVGVTREKWPRLEETWRCPVSADAQAVIASKDVDAVIISTPPQQHISLIEKCLKQGKDVLCEKPVGGQIDEIRRITNLANKEGRILKCGFNLHHDAGLEKAKRCLDQGLIGRPYFLKAHYVNGAVLSNTNGVGSLIDLGCHLLDLVNWFDGPPVDLQGYLQKAESPRDDNGFIAFRTQKMSGQIHFSYLRWKNDFRFEISGEKGGIEVVSLPKWGKQQVHLYRRVYPSGVPETITEEFTEDLSWRQEWEVFRRLVRERDLSYNNHALTIMEQIRTIQKEIPVVATHTTNGS